MTVIDIRKDTDQLSLTVTAEFDAPLEQVWQLWGDPRRLERWWGPPTHPATVVDHELAPGGAVTYFMTSPEGDQYHGWWRVLAVDAPRSLRFEDGFADNSGTPNPDMPVTTANVQLEPRAGGGTRMTIATTFSSLEQMEQLVEMGMVEGLTAALGQADGLLAAA